LLNKLFGERRVNELIRTEVDGDGVLVATIDMADRTMNVFSAELMDELDALMDRVDTDPAVKSCVVTSGKPSFLAGADLVMVRGYCDAAAASSHEQMFEMCGRLGRQFVRLEASAKPWVAAVNGLALGGGLELSLACRTRIVSDDPRLQLGVPEVRWGLLPGAGGTQRLPRLVGFEAAMGMLLSGRSVDPGTAVRMGLFAEALPADRLLDRARALARAQHGQPSDATAKYRNLAETDVPEHSDATAQAIALKHGVGAEDFGLYPAYSAIVDSVLKGARLPLADANAVEMNQFLRLMFSPVAGRMVRTLFLERLRAERELAAPSDIKIERLAHGQLGAANEAWAEALGKLKLPRALDPALPADALELFDAGGQRHRFALRVLGQGDPNSALPQALLAPPGPYGRVVEIVGADDASAAAMAALSARLWSLPWRTPGPLAVLPRLAGLTLEQQAEAACACAAEPGAGDPAFLDVAACLAGLSPAWSGGPLTWAAGERAAAAAA
jgi:3-hydroxyacyl-CoA dehydrogenase/enoyl-CoA hydratase/3-hydroxybutyryl-CoA epimerase